MQGTELLMKECRSDIGAPPGAFRWLNAAVARAPKLRESNKHGPGDFPSCTKTLCNQRGSWGLPLGDCVKQFLDACSDLVNDAPDFFE